MLPHLSRRSALSREGLGCLGRSMTDPLDTQSAPPLLSPVLLHSALVSGLQLTLTLTAALVGSDQPLMCGGPASLWSRRHVMLRGPTPSLLSNLNVNQTRGGGKIMRTTAELDSK